MLIHITYWKKKDTRKALNAEKLIPRIRRVHEADFVMCHPDRSSLKDLMPKQQGVLLADSLTPAFTPCRHCLNQPSAVSQPLQSHTPFQGGYI